MTDLENAALKAAGQYRTGNIGALPSYEQDRLLALAVPDVIGQERTTGLDLLIQHAKKAFNARAEASMDCPGYTRHSWSIYDGARLGLATEMMALWHADAWLLAAHALEAAHAELTEPADEHRLADDRDRARDLRRTIE